MSLTAATTATPEVTSPTSPTLKHEPRRSNRVGDALDVAQADGDTWQEKIAVCEGVTQQGTPRLLLRSYFRNNRTKQRVWDEPPSGASNIRFATPKDRKAAEQQLQELQLTLDMIPPESPDSKETPKKKDDGKKGFFGRFRRKDKQQQQQQQQVNESQDLNLQRAIARSMMDQGGIDASPSGRADSPVIFYDPDRPSTEPNKFDDDDIALAKAISMSESAQPSMSEEELLLMAIEESKLEAERSRADAGVAALPNNSGDEFDIMHAFNDTSKGPPDLIDEDMDQKMPALKRSPHSAVYAFDPYSVNHTTNPSNDQSAPCTSPPMGLLDAYPSSGVEQLGDSSLSASRSSSAGQRKMFSRGGRKEKMENDAGIV